MSGILRSSSRLVNTAKYATNNSTQYLRMVPPDKNFNTSSALNSPNDNSDLHPIMLLDTQANKKTSYNPWKIMKVSLKNLMPIFANKLPDKKETLFSPLGNFVATQSSGKIGLITKKKETNFIFPAAFTTKLNGELVEPLSDTIASEKKRPISYRVGGLNLFLDGDKLKFKVKDRDETFVINHSVYVESVQENPELKIQKILKPLNNNLVKYVGPSHLRDMYHFNAELTLKTPKGPPEHRVYRSRVWSASFAQWYGFGDFRVPEKIKKTTESNVTDADKTGRVQLQFPMALSLQGFKQEIKIGGTHEIFTIYHKVDLECFKELNKQNKVADKTSKIGIIEILLESGDLNIRTQDPVDPGYDLRHEVWIQLDLDAEIPIMDINPFLKRKVTYSTID